MSFFSPDLHEAQQHAPYFEYNTFQGPLCLACFLHSIADDGQLDSRKTFVLRCAFAVLQTARHTAACSTTRCFTSRVSKAAATSTQTTNHTCSHAPAGSL